MPYLYVPDWGWYDIPAKTKFPARLIASREYYFEVMAVASMHETELIAEKFSAHRRKSKSKNDLFRNLQSKPWHVAKIRPTPWYQPKDDGDDWKDAALREAFGDALGADILNGRCSIIRFCSQSSGKRIIGENQFHHNTQIILKRLGGGHLLIRRKRTMRSVEFLKVTMGGGHFAYYPIVRGEIRDPKHNHTISIDVLAQEILYHLDEDKRSVDTLLALAEKTERLKERGKEL